MEIIKAPDNYLNYRQPLIFMAGVIDMGKARDWQAELADMLHHDKGTLLNPRRDDWDSSWKQEIGNTQFRQQVEWELRGQEDADLIIVHFDSDSSAPITLLELGLGIGARKNMIVHCASGFYRKGNVDIVCRRYGIEMVDSLPLLAEAIREFDYRVKYP